MKIATIFILAIVVIAVLSGCGKQNPPAQGTSVEKEAINPSPSPREQSSPAPGEAATISEVNDSLIDQNDDVDVGKMI